MIVVVLLVVVALGYALDRGGTGGDGGTGSDGTAAQGASTGPSSSGPSTAPTPSADPRVLSFAISTFNVLGNSHTTSTGKDPDRASGRVRAGWAARLLDSHDIEVVGFQELQAPQLAGLRQATRGAYRFFPGSSMTRRDSENSLAWRTDRWKALRLETLRTPYFNGNLRTMPVVLLQSRVTGQRVWFANFHNPANTRQFNAQQQYRDEATTKHAALINRLLRQTRLPVLVTGDMNERAEYFCAITAMTPLKAARGGSNTDGRCRADNPRAIDWILGSPRVRFGDYTEDRSAFVRRTTDHPFVYAEVHLDNPAATG